EQLQDCNTALGAVRGHEESSRAALTSARAAVEHAERTLRELQDRVHEADLNCERTQRELDETMERESVLERERAALASTAMSARRELEQAAMEREQADRETDDVLAGAERARADEKHTRDADAAARAALFDADEAHAALE